MSERNAGLVRSLYEAFARGDVDEVLATMATDVEWQEAEGMPYGGTYHGGQEIVEHVFGPVMEDMPDFKPTPQELIASGDQVAVVVRYTGTGRETGKALDLGVVHVWDVRGGEVTRFRQFVDTVKFREVVPGRTQTTA